MAVLKGTIQIDSSPAVAALKATADAGGKAAKEITDSFKKALTAKVSTADSAKAFDGIRKAALDSVAEQKSALASLIASGQQGSKAFEAAKNQLVDAAKEARRLDDALEAVNKEVDGVNTKKITIGEQLKSGLAGGLAGGLIGGGVAGAVTSAVGLLTEGIAKVIDLGSSFETGMQSLSAVTGATGATLDDLGNRARDLATQFGGSANEQLTVFQTTLSKIGPQLANSPEALGKFAENVNILGKTDAALGAAGAVDALTGAMLQFGVDVNNSNEVAAESSRFINVLAASAAVGSASVSQVAEAIAVVGATAKNSNVSFEETNAALQVLASKSLVGSQAGTGLTTVLNKLQAQSTDGDKALQALGTSSAELGQLLNTGGIGPAISKLRSAMEGLGTQAEKNALLNKLFGEGGQNAAAALLGGEDMLAQFTKGVTNTNSATEQATINMSTLSETWSRVIATIQDVAIGIYQAVAPVLQTIIGLFSNTLGPIFSRLGETMGGAFSRVASILKPILAVIGGIIISNIVSTITYVTTVLSTMYDIFIRAFDAVKNAIKPAIDAIVSLTGGMGDAIDPVKAFQDILEIMTTVMSETGKVVADVAGVVIEFAVSGIQFLAGAVAKLVGLFKSQNTESDDLNKNTEKGVPILERIKKVFDNIRGTLVGLTFSFREIKLVVMEFFDALSDLDIKKALEAFTGFGDRVKKAYDDGFNSVQRARAEADAAAAAEKERTEAAEQRAVAEAAAADASGKSSKDEGTALEKALKQYAKQAAAIEGNTKLIKTQAQVALDAGRITQAAFEATVSAADADALTAKYEAAIKTLQASTDDIGLFVNTSIKLDKDETDLEIRTILADLASKRKFEIPVVVTLVGNQGRGSVEDDILETIEKIKSRGGIKPLPVPIAVDTSLFKESDLTNAVDAIAGAFRGLSEDQKKSREESIKNIGEEERALTQSFKKGETDIANFQQKMDELRTKRAQLGEGESLVDRLVGATQDVAFDTINKKFNTLKDDAVKKFNELKDGGSIALNELGKVVAFTFGAGLASAIQAGNLTFGSALAMLADAVLSAFELLVPLVGTQFLGFLGPIVGPALAAIAIAGLRAALTSATSDVGAESGVGVITKGYSGKRGPNDNINLWVAEGEGIANRAANMRNAGLVDFINKGGDAKDWALQHASREDLMRALNLDKLGISFSGIDRSIGNAIQAEIRSNTVVIDFSPLTAELTSMRKELKALRRDVKGKQTDIHVYPSKSSNIETLTIGSGGF